MKKTTLKEQITAKIEDLNIYFSEQKDQILADNLHVYKMVSILSTAVVLLYIVLAPLHKSVHIGPLHYLFLGLMALHALVAEVISRHRLKHKAVERAVLVSFGLCVFLAFIATDTLGSPLQSQIFCSAFLVIAPVIYIMSASRMIIDQLFFVVVFALFAYHYKEPAVAARDMYAIWAGFLFGTVLYFIITSLRLQVNAEVIRLKHFSESDELTKIKNLRAANAQIPYLLARRAPGTACAMLMLDLDYFKTINDTYGHEEGDRVLRAVAAALAGTFRKSDVVARIGGDEFLAFISGFADDKFLQDKCEEICQRVRQITVGGRPASCSIGLCILEAGSCTMDEMKRNADAALYETKNRGRGGYTIHRIG